MVQFGSYHDICEKSPLLVCPLVQETHGISQSCYTRTLEVGSLTLLEATTIPIYIITILMLGIMIYNIKSKYSAIGRKELATLFYIYFAMNFLEVFLVIGIVPIDSLAYQILVSFHFGGMTAFSVCLVLNGFVVFDLVREGSPLSLWIVRLTSLSFFIISFSISFSTFRNVGPFRVDNPVGVWALHFVVNGILVLIFVISQLLYLFKLSDDLWPLGALTISLFFYIFANVSLFKLSTSICEVGKHYLDGLFLYNICTLLSIMMLYKYWDGITYEDLEFSIGGSKFNNWELKKG